MQRSGRKNPIQKEHQREGPEAKEEGLCCNNTAKRQG